MSLKRTCNTQRLMFMAGMVLLFVLNLPMLYVVWRQQPMFAGLRFHLNNFRDKATRVEKQTAKNPIKVFVAAPATRPSNIRYYSTKQTSMEANTAQLLGPEISVSKNESTGIQAPTETSTLNETGTKESCAWPNGSGKQRWCLNSIEVQNMRQHILKFYNPEKNMTLTKTSVRIGQGLKYGSAFRPKKSKSFKVTDDFFKLIPEESPLKGRHFNTCAVVGNSGIVLNSSCGQEIDSMDFVIRCNLPQIEGYEKDVGSKANLTTMNPSVVKNNFGQWNNKTHTDYDRLLERLKQVGDQILYVPVLTSAFGEKYARVIIQIILQHNLSMKTAFPPAGINKLMNKIWTEAGYKIVALRPSTGAHMYTLAATICDQIHMYGFYPFSEDTRGRALRHHYYDTKEMISHTANRTHNMPEEFRAFQKLHMRGALVLHTEPCH
ncbi:CMP-N-acetylneuraminate-poly-alpha-2,8-sialyltransferase-like [Branchiostoma floridae x Branchiostoma japonicum]